MKHLKQKLIAATTMMLLCAIMLSSVSYAWFTLSTNPEIKNMEATVSANQNLEIALDNGYADEAAVDTASVYSGTAQGSTTGNPYTWGNLVDLGVAFDNFMPNMQPVKFTNTDGTVKLEAPKYGVDGRVSSLAELTGKTFTDLATITGEALKGGVKGYSVTGTAAPYYAFSVDFWVRSNVAGDLALQTAAGIDRAEDNDTTNNNVNNTEGTGCNFTIPNYNNLTDEQKAAVEAYFLKMKVAFVLEDKTTVQATISSKKDGTFEITCAKITTLARNDAQLVKMYVYLDGETITNKDAILSDISGVIFNIQFKNTAITGSQAATGNDA